MTEPLLRIQFDETSLYGRFNKVDSKLDRHEEMILELQKLLKGVTNQGEAPILTNKYDEKINELDAKCREYDSKIKELDEKSKEHDSKIKELDEKSKEHDSKINELHEKNKEHDSKIDELHNIISNLDKKFNTAIKDMNDLKSTLDERLSQLTDFFNIKLRQQYQELSGLIPRDDFKFGDFEDRIKNCEKDIKNNKDNISYTRTSVSQIATSIASLTNKKANLDSSLPQTMNESMHFVKSNFDQVYIELNNLKEQLLSGSTLTDNSRNTSISPRPQILSPRVTPSPITTPRSSKSEESPTQNDDKTEQKENQYNNLMIKQKEQLNQQPMILNINKGIGKPTVIHHESISKPPYDLSSIRPYQSMKVNWQDKPELPPIHQFIKLEEAIDHIYRIQPPLQAYLNAMHKKIIENTSKIEDKIDKDAVHKMFQRFQSIVGELRSHIDNLKKNIENTATRDEINDIFEELLRETRNEENQTAIGRVRCIACGREMNQVAGAMTEAELARALGTPPNSIAHRSGITNVGVSYNASSRGKMDSEIIESPRSVRPSKQKRMKAMIKPT